MFKSIRWRITIPYTVIILMTALGMTLYISETVRHARLADMESRLVAEAALMAKVVPAYLTGAPDMATLQGLAHQWSDSSGERVTVIGPDGTVLAESHADSTQMDNHLYRPEVQAAIKEGVGFATRYSKTLRRDVMYAAVPAFSDSDNALVGIVRVSLPLDQIEANVSQLRNTIVVAGLIAAMLAIVVAFYVASHTINPIRRLTEVVERIAEGDLSARLLPVTRDEVGQLTRAFNHMADQLREKVAVLAREQRRLSAVLSNMADGVIITDDVGNVVLVNAAAARILRISAEGAQGHSFAQVVYNHQLISLWNQCLATGKEQSGTVETMLRRGFLQAVITPLPDVAPPRMLVILQDLTRVRRLETVRRDFISNVSHELRTPLASLAVVVETLRDGALDDPPAARRFLQHMESELTAMTQMVEELLELSRIESNKVPLKIKPTRVRKLVTKPVNRLLPQAEREGVTVHIQIPSTLPKVLADAKRIHQVVANLVHNAVKFTPAGGEITISADIAATDDAGAAPGEVVIAVKDTGIGIPAEDVLRIFERFYKTDRARSQDGTGLGLAIAKHIVQGHGGRIWVESREGVGSTFYFTLPIAVEVHG